MAIHIYQLISIILFIICAKPPSSAHASSLYYPDLSIQYGSSCAEKTQFATTNDPFYDWVIRSYLNEGFETDNYITIQEAGLAYKKLSAWRVADSSSSNATVLMFNAPEPHVLGGFYRPHPHNIIARMTVNWGLSIRVCLGYIFQEEGQNMCRITGQVIALEQDGNITFNMLLSEVYYVDSEMTHLTNWVSNARIPEAVGVDRTVGMKNNKNFWYYSNLQLANLCSRMAVEVR